MYKDQKMSRICGTSICNIQRPRIKLRENYDVRSVEKIYAVHSAILKRKKDERKKEKVSEIKYQILYGKSVWLFYSNEEKFPKKLETFPASQFLNIFHAEEISFLEIEGRCSFN